MQGELDAAASRLDPDTGVMAQFVHLTDDTGPGRLLLVLHHLVVDGVSWRILLPDLADAWQHVRDGLEPPPAPASTSLRRWAHALAETANTPSAKRNCPTGRRSSATANHPWEAAAPTPPRTPPPPPTPSASASPPTSPTPC